MVSLLQPINNPQLALFTKVGGLGTSRPDLRREKGGVGKGLFLHRCSQPNIFIKNCKVCVVMDIPQSNRVVQAPCNWEAEQGLHRHSWCWEPGW